MPNASKRGLCEEIKLANKRGLFVDYSPSSLSFRFVLRQLVSCQFSKVHKFFPPFFLGFHPPLCMFLHVTFVQDRRFLLSWKAVTTDMEQCYS